MFGGNRFQQQQPNLFGGQQQPGFGQQPAQNQPAFGANTFGGGGFGATGTTFGQPATTPAFGQPAQNNAFGQPSQGNTFGQPATGFGATNTFGQPAQNTGFGQPTTTPAFGQPAQNTGFGFGGQTQNTGFGATNTNAFGAKPAFGATFGATNTGFGGGASAPTSQTVNNGTGNPAWSVTVERDGAISVSQSSNFQSISAMSAYKNWSVEELRFQDYQMNKKGPGSVPTAAPTQPATTGLLQILALASATNTFGAKPAFGQPTTSTFGQPAATTAFGQPSTNTFGQPAAAAPAFGQPAATPAFGQPATNTTFGQPAQNTGFGGFGATPNKPAFGKHVLTLGAPTTTSGFGATPAPAFGAATTAPAFGTTPAPAFGAANTTATPAFGAQTNTTSLFGNKPATTFGAPAATTGFGQPAAAPAFGAGGTTSTFGAAAKPAFGFGNTTTPAAGGGLFGATTTQPAAGTTNLFGATTQPATNTAGAPAFGNTGGLFGATTTTNQPAATGLFGQPAATSQPLFGGAQPATNTTTSLFANKPATFGAPATTFGGLNTQQPTTSLFGNSTTGNLFSNSTNQNQPVLHASLDKNPYGNNPLLQKSTNVAPTSQQPAPITPQKDSKLPTMNPNFKTTPRSTAQIKLRGVAPPSPAPALAESARNQIGATPKKSLHLLDGSPRDIATLGLDSRFTPKRSVKRLVIDDASAFLPSPAKFNDEALKTNTLDPALVEAAAKKESDSQKLATTPTTIRVAQPVSSVSPADKSKQYVMTPSIEKLLHMSDEELRSVKDFKVKVPLYGSIHFLEPVDLLAASPTGTRAGIKEIPGNVIQIKPQVVIVNPDEDNKVPVGTGVNVRAKVTLLGCWAKDKATGDIIDNQSDPRYIKHMEKLKNMPDTEFFGFEQASGAWAFTVDHFSKYGLLDDDDEEDVSPPPETISKPVKQVHFEMDTSGVEDTFLEIKRRGKTEELMENEDLLEDLDEESADLEDESEVDEEEDSMEEDVEESEEQSSEYSEEILEEEPGEPQEETEEESESDVEKENIPKMPENYLPTIEKFELARNVQSMKATLFSHSKPTQKPAVAVSNKAPSFTFNPVEKRNLDEPTKSPDSLVGRTLFSKPVDIIEKPVEIVSPKKYFRQSDPTITNEVNCSQIMTSMPAFKESIVYGKQDQYVDASLFMGRSFRVGWTPCGKFIAGSKKKNSLVTLAIHKPQIYQNESMDIERSDLMLSTILENSERHLTVKQGNQEIIVETPQDLPDHFSTISSTAPFHQNVCPKSVFSKSLSFQELVARSEGAGSNSDIFDKNEKEIWKLCSALWDALVIDSDLGIYDEEQSQIIKQAFRKTMFSDWLRQVSESNVAGDLKNCKTPIEKVYYKLTGRQIAPAIQDCIKNRDFKLAIIMSQIGGAGSQVGVECGNRVSVPNGVPGRGGMNTDVLKDLTNQYLEWKTQLINENYMAIYNLLGGSVSNWNSSVFRSLDWKRSFGLFFWYAAGGALSIEDSFTLYENNLSEITKPISKFDSGSLDIQYLLLQLFTNPTNLLEPILETNTHTSQQLDYRISFLLGNLLKLKNIQGFQDEVTLERITCNFVAGLESIGLWKWAIFVSTFLSSFASRRGMIQDLLFRWYPVDDHSGSFYSKELSEDYKFLAETCLIPSKWIHEARVVKARYLGYKVQESISLIDSQDYKKAQDLIIGHLMPPRVLSGNVTFLITLLEQIPTSTSSYRQATGFLLKHFKNENTADDPEDLKEFQAYKIKDTHPLYQASMHKISQTVDFQKVLSN
ncbi:Nuclear pore complex protein Nup98-Nup96 [Boothiomyces macroporosus]|uniref:Nuclear pore complex protein Nup98-Nup96 n=1 Tax=Boothiomyces macroporosus TaxID=261099 RepID=A0AAD5UN27_9FUNG|nr:Nuclear pore complex protein Nup98-Nup96 [Boothiomyces macroporosus]